MYRDARDNILLKRRWREQELDGDEFEITRRGASFYAEQYGYPDIQFWNPGSWKEAQEREARLMNRRQFSSNSVEPVHSSDIKGIGTS